MSKKDFSSMILLVMVGGSSVVVWESELHVIGGLMPVVFLQELLPLCRSHLVVT